MNARPGDGEQAMDDLFTVRSAYNVMHTQPQNDENITMVIQMHFFKNAYKDGAVYLQYSEQL